MAIPENIETIGTNLPLPRLRAFLVAVDDKTAQWVEGSTSVFAESAGCEFDFGGGRYTLDEFVEVVTSVRLKSGEPALVQAIIDELEVELSLVVQKRKYRDAEKINEKIEDLKRLLRVKSVQPA